jgi:hypothetical protein
MGTIIIIGLNILENFPPKYLLENCFINPKLLFNNNAAPAVIAEQKAA